MPDSSPNFLILMVDQMSGALFDQDMIAHLHIPNMRALIDKGVTFEKAYCSSPLCTPARGSFMNGMLPSRSGIYDNAAEFTASTPTYAHYLRNMGYQTALSGKMHFVGPDQLHGFEERLPDVWLFDDAMQQLARLGCFIHRQSWSQHLMRQLKVSLYQPDRVQMRDRLKKIGQGKSAAKGPDRTL